MSPTSEHDPDRAWKPNNRPQSTIALNFMTELDDLFRLDGGIDVLDKNVHQKKQAVTSHTQELEAIEAKLRETEHRLREARNSPPRPTESHPNTPPDQPRQPTPATTPRAPRAPRGALSEHAHSDNSTEYVMVEPDDGEPAKP